MPAAVAGEAVLIRTDTVAVWVGSLRAYPNGFEFTLRALRRDPPPWEGSERPYGDPFAAGLRFELRYADGRSSAAVGAEPGVDALELTQSIGGGTDFAWDAHFWVAPLPPEGPVTFVADWAAAGAPAERRADFDGAAIRAAAARCVQAWPEEPYLPGNP